MSKTYRTRGPDFLEPDGWGGMRWNTEGYYGVRVHDKKKLTFSPEEQKILESIKYLDLMNMYQNIYMAEKGHTKENPVFNVPSGVPPEFGPQLQPPPELVEPPRYSLMPPETKGKFTALDYINDMVSKDKLAMYEGDFLKPRPGIGLPEFIAGVTSPFYKAPEWLLDAQKKEGFSDEILHMMSGKSRRGEPTEGADTIFTSLGDLSDLNKVIQERAGIKFPNLGNQSKTDIVLHELGHLQKTKGDDRLVHEKDVDWNEMLKELLSLSLEGIK